MKKNRLIQICIVLATVITMIACSMFPKLTDPVSEIERLGIDAVYATQAAATTTAAAANATPTTTPIPTSTPLAPSEGEKLIAFTWSDKISGVIITSQIYEIGGMWYMLNSTYPEQPRSWWGDNVILGCEGILDHNTWVFSMAEYTMWYLPGYVEVTENKGVNTIECSE